MNSPYMGKFKVTQEYKGNAHDGLDLVGLDSKEIHATVNGVVKAASNTDPKGFGINVKILKDGTNDYSIYGHMSEVRCKVGDRVKITDVIGMEGSTGNSTGSHCHYCVRTGNTKGKHRNICVISGIPNARGVYDDGYRPEKYAAQPGAKPSGVTMLKPGTWNVRRGPSLNAAVARIVKGPQSVTYVDIVDGFYLLRDGCYIGVNACQ